MRAPVSFHTESSHDPLTQTLHTYLQEHPEAVRICVLLFPQRHLSQIRQEVARASLATGIPIDLLACLEVNLPQTAHPQTVVEQPAERGEADDE